MDLYCFPEINVPADLDGACGQHPTPDGEDELSHKISVIEAQAFEDGYKQGCSQNLEGEKGKLAPLKEMLVSAAVSLQDQSILMRDQCEESTVKIALALAGRMISREIEQRPELADAMLHRTVAMGLDQEKLKIKANDGDCVIIQRILKEHLTDPEALSNIQVTPDPAISRGGCVLETDFGVIDARIEQQLATIAEHLLQAVSETKAALRRSDSEHASLTHYRQKVQSTVPVKTYGHVTQVVGLIVEANGPAVKLGAMCDILASPNEPPVTAEVLGFRDRTVLMMPLEEIRSIGPGSKVVARGEKASIAVGPKLLGRVIDGLGTPIDGQGPVPSEVDYPIYASPINPLLRQRIKTPLDLGVRVINGLLTVGCGQRMGIFAGSGVGKSVLMGMIARESSADVNVIALIGERGRELNDFLEKELGEEGLRKSVVVVATSDHLPLVRVRGAFVATAIAEYFRDQGMSVNLMMDSLTRFAMAQREIGLALGEPPTTKGYTPSVFTMLPKLLERAGTSDHDGSITGLYTVLVEGDDMNEPIADAARSILDGHIVLSRELAHQNHYPAIDVLKSISRVMEDIASLQHKHHAKSLKELLATYRKSEDLINIGAYVSGSNPTIDRAIAKIGQINGFLRQDIGEKVGFEESLQQLEKVIITQ